MAILDKLSEFGGSGKIFSQRRIHYVTPSGFSICGNPNFYKYVIPSGLKAMSRILHAE
jgi:hypothetical protein